MLVDKEHFWQAIEWMRKHEFLAVDTETDGLDLFLGNRLVGISVGDHNTGLYFPFRHGEGENLPKEFLIRLIRAIDATPRIVGFNLTFDLHALMNEGLKARKPGSIEEVQVAAHLFNENDFNRYLGRASGLKELATKYLGPNAAREEESLRELIGMTFGKREGNRKAWKGHMWRLPAAQVEEYATADAVLTMQLRDFYLARLNREGLVPLYKEMCDYTLLLQQMAYNGVKIDRPLCEHLYNQTEADAAAAASRFRELVGDPDLNLNSSPQMHALFREESVTSKHLKVWANTEANDHRFETAEEGEWAARRAEMAMNLLTFRAAEKMHGSYFAKYLPLLDRNDMLHPGFNVTGTETGRLSCSNPNLQAIPRDVENHKVKLLFLPSEPEGYLVEMDYSQAEIHLASFYGCEWTMAGHLQEGRDIHTATAEMIGCDRDTAKRINFSAIYGIGAMKYSQTYGVPYDESKVNLENYHRAYPGFRQLYNNAELTAGKHNVLALPNGRRRHFSIPVGHLKDTMDLHHHRVLNMSLRGDLRKASSNLVQGMVAAFMMKAMLHIWRDVPEMRMILTVHDSLIFDVQGGWGEWQLAEMITETRQIMENPAPDDPAFQTVGVPGHPDIPMKVDVKLGQDRWGTLSRFDPETFGSRVVQKTV